MGSVPAVPLSTSFSLDPRVRYPSYVSMDRFIDVDRLRSLDGYLRDRIRQHIIEHDDPKFSTGPYTLSPEHAGLPGSRMIHLTRSSEPERYLDLDRTELWSLAPAADEFTKLMDFIETLPFSSIGRALIMYDHVPRQIPPHRDHVQTEILHEFIWFRTNLDKPFYMLDSVTDEKRAVTSYSAWFDTVNQFHGCEPTNNLTFSIRVDGRFTDEFRSQFSMPQDNAASAPSLWASIIENQNKL